MNIFEGLRDLIPHRNDHNQEADVTKPDSVCKNETPCLECPTAKLFVDQRSWFSDPTETITTEHQAGKDSSGQAYTSTIFTKLTKPQFEDIAEKIQTIHSTENAIDVAHYYALAHGVLNGMDPSSIVIMATINTEENTQVPIGYAYISGTPRSKDALRDIGVMVIPEYRKKGVAFQLFKDLLCHAAEFGITQVQIDFRTDNMPIWKFLTKASDPEHQLISFTKEVYGSETVAKITLLMCK